MKKRVACLLLAALFLFTLFPAALAVDENESETQEAVRHKIDEISVDVTEPEAGKNPAKPTVSARSDGAGGNLKQGQGKDYVLDYRWRDAATGDAPSKFESGHTYELIITLKGALANYDLAGDAVVVHNGDTVKVKSVKYDAEGENDLAILFSYTTREDITPTVAVKSGDVPVKEIKKEYDGQEVVLTAEVAEPLQDVKYSYQWMSVKSKTPVAINGATGQKLTLRNVKDSGEYLCRVKADGKGGLSKSVDSDSVIVEISVHTIVLRIDDKTKPAGSQDSEYPLTYDIDGDVYDELKVELVREAGEAAGEYDITIASIAFDDEVAENYKVDVTPGKYVIEGSGLVTFVTLPDSAVSDQSSLMGKKAKPTQVKATEGALPSGAVLNLSDPDENALAAFSPAQEGREVMKGLAVSVNGGDQNGSFNKNAVVRLLIPLTEEEEKYDASTIKALFRPKGGAVEKVSCRVEKNKETGVLYVALEIRSPGEVVLLKGDLLPDDKRLTSFGRSLRGSSMDELPEAFNILKGDMSIVGPRPQLVRDMVFMTPEQRMRHTARPGLSGLAQVMGRNAIAWEDKFKWDLKYIQKVSLWNDVKIILKTVSKVFIPTHTAESSEETDVALDYGDALLKRGDVSLQRYRELQAEARRILSSL